MTVKPTRVGDRAQPNSQSIAVLFLLNGLGIAGSERKSVAVVNELYRAGQNVHLAYLDSRTQLLGSVERGVPLVFLNRQRKFSISAVKALRTYLIRHNIARIACINLFPLVYAAAAISMLPVRLRPAVILFQNTTEHTSWKAKLLESVYAPIVRRAEQIVFGCCAQRKLWIKRLKLNPKRCRVIYNGIDQNRFKPQEGRAAGETVQYGIQLLVSDFVIGAVGNLWPNKNHMELILAFIELKESVPNARLLIAGEGSERDRIEAAIKSGGLMGRVALLGKVEDVRPVLHRIDVFVLPSIYETFSNATLEAMSMEKPVVVKKTGGMPEMIRHGVDGYMYDDGDVSGLASILRELSSKSDTRLEIGQNARKAVLEQFTFSRMANEYRELLFGREIPSTPP